MKKPSAITVVILLKSILVILLIAAIFQGCNGCGVDSDDPGTSRGNDTITTEHRFKDGPYDNTGVTTTPGANNGTSPNDVNPLDTSVNARTDNTSTPIDTPSSDTKLPPQ